MTLWKRRNAVRDLVFNHMQCVGTALQAYQSACSAYLEEHDEVKAAQYALETHQAEGHADDIRRQVEKEMVSGALLPPSRRQILELVERIDSLANAAEAALDRLLIQSVRIPQELEEPAVLIIRETALIWDEVQRCITVVFEGMPEEALESTDQIEHAEARVDHIERDALKRLFGMDLDLARKLQISSVFGDLAEISDRAEDLADRIALIVAERAY